jgi:hypothetical protein
VGVWGEAGQADVPGPVRGVYGAVATSRQLIPEQEQGYNTAGVHGANTGASGVFPWNNNMPLAGVPTNVAPSTYGVLGDNGISPEENPLVAQSRLGVLGTVDGGTEVTGGTSSAGVMGVNTGPVSPPRGVGLYTGISETPDFYQPNTMIKIPAPVESPNGTAAAEYGVRGTTSSKIAGSAGVLGETEQRQTAGVYGRCVITNSFTGEGEPGACFGVYSDGDMYVDGNLYVTGAKAGYVIDIARNAGDEPLETGDVVVVIGSDAPVIGDIPTPLVVKAGEAYDTAVLGVVELTEDGEGVVEPGETCKIVTLGAFRTIKADASFGAIEPGDLLVSSPTAGHAQAAKVVEIEGVPFVPAGVIGKALTGLDEGAGTIEVFVTLK